MRCSEGGLGIGLALVRNLVRLHGGEASVRSDGPGQGSEFTIELPAAASNEPAATRAGSEPSAQGRSRRVLVVDDNVDAAELLGDALQMLGHEVAVVHDGPAALAAVERFRPDLAVLDVGLPQMDGHELARRLRALVPECRLIALTGYGQEADRARSMEAGFDVHLVKPVNLAQLAQFVDN